MTENAQIDHRKYFNCFTLSTAGGQFESLKGVIWKVLFLHGSNYTCDTVNIYANDSPLFSLIRKYIQSQRANATTDCFANSVCLVHVFTKKKNQNNNAELSKHRLEHQF